MSNEPRMHIVWALFVTTTLFQAATFAVWPDTAPAASYLYGTFHGAFWLWLFGESS